MGLLNEGRKLLAEKQAAERKREEERDAKFKRLKQWGLDRLNRFVEKLQEIKGKKTTLGTKIKIDVDRPYSKVTILSGKTKMVEVLFSHDETLKYESDGGAWGTGDYYPADRMRILLPYEGTYGKHEGGEGASFESLREQDLAMFFAQYIKG